MKSAVESLLEPATRVTPELLEELAKELAEGVANQHVPEMLDELLVSAIERGQAELVRVIGTSPLANLNATDQQGRPCLVVAVERNHPSVVHELIAAGANVNQGYQQAALHRAVYGPEFGKCGPSFDTEVEWPGFTALHFAAGSGKVDAVDELLRAPGIDVNGACRDTPSPLMLAGISGHLQCFDRLLQAPGVDLDFRDSNGRDVLDFCLAGVEFYGLPTTCLYRLLSDDRFVESATLEPCIVLSG